MRIVVTADIHLGSPIRSTAMRNPELGERLKRASRDTFATIIDIAISENIDVIVLAGDIFDDHVPDLRSRAFLITQLSRAAEAGIPTVLIRGNHDALLDHRAQGELGPNIHLLHKDAPTVEISGVAFHGLSFDKAHTSRSFLPDFPLPITGIKNVGLMHTSLGGSPVHDPYAPCSERELMAHGFDLWCLGHIHAPFERRSGSALAVMPGIPQPRHFGERMGGTITIVDLGQDPPELSRRNVGELRFLELSLDLSQCTDQQDLLRELRSGLLEAQDPNRDTAVRLNIDVSRHTTEEMNALVEEVLGGIDGVYLDKLKTCAPASQSSSSADDLLRLMREEAGTASLSFAVSELLEELGGSLPSEISAELAESSISELLEEAMSEVALSMHSRESD